MADKITVTEMCDTSYEVMTSTDHKMVLVHVNKEDIYLYSPDEAREYGKALITAADKVDPVEVKAEPVKPVVAAVKTA